MIKNLASRVREYWTQTILTPLFMIGEVLMETLIPYFMADLVDKGINAGDMGEIKRIGIKLAIIAVVSLCCGTLSGIFGSIASAGFAKNLRHDLYYKIQSFSFSNIDKFTSSGLVTRMTTDITSVQMAFMMFTRMAFRSPGLIIFSMIMTLRISSRIALIMVIIVPILAAAVLFIMTRAFPLFEKTFSIYDKLNSVVQENIRGIRVVKSFVREEKEEEKFSNVSGDLYKTFVKAETIVAFSSPVMQFCMYACSILIAWFGAHLVVQNSMSTGQLMSVITYSVQILSSLMMLCGLIVMGTIAGASAKRIDEVLSEDPDICDCADPVMTLQDGSIVFDHVSFGYGKSKDCLRDIHFEIKSGETVGIIGGTGSGKSSLVQLIPRLYDVRSGRVLVGGTDVRKLDLTALRKEVSMVLQKNVLFSGTVADNLKWGNEKATEEDMKKACRLAQAEGFVSTMEKGLDSWIEQGGSNVSGGQRQRLCIARALMSNPKILILDDSTSAVDTHTEAMIRKAFREEIPQTTKLIIAQRVTSVMDADRIIVLDDGQISGMGTHEELLANNKIYQEVYNSQMKGGGDFDAPQQ